MKGNERKLSSADVSMKWILIVFNLVFLITGISMIAAGAYLTEYSLTDYNAELPMNGTIYEFFFNVRSSLLINTLYILGTIIAVISFLGCIGALMESIFILMLFSICLGIVFIMELTLMTTGYSMKDYINDSLEGDMNRMMHDYESDDASRRIIDETQKMYRCCGINGCEDWQKHFTLLSEYDPDAEVVRPHKPPSYMTSDMCHVNTNEGLVRVQFPSSCCVNHRLNGECLGIYERGCVPYMGFHIWKFYIYIAFSFLSVQITGIIVACFLVKSLYMKKAKPVTEVLVNAEGTHL